MSKRHLQLASIVHRAVQSVITEGLADPRLDSLVTITRVKVAENLSSATIHVSILPEKAESKSIHALQDAARFIRREAAERVALHKMPDLLFKIDRSTKKQADLLEAFSKVKEERAANNDPNQANPPESQDSTTGDHT